MTFQKFSMPFRCFSSDLPLINNTAGGEPRQLAAAYSANYPPVVRSKYGATAR